MKDIEQIVDHKKVTDIFGKWPSFHDAEVVSIGLDRDAGEEQSRPLMTVKIHVFRLEVGPNDPTRDNRLVTFKFKAVEALTLSAFNHQNALNGISFERQMSERLKRDVFNVVFHQGFGLGCKFQCDEVEVNAVDSYTPL